MSFSPSSSNNNTGRTSWRRAFVALEVLGIAARVQSWAFTFGACVLHPHGKRAGTLYRKCPHVDNGGNGHVLFALPRGRKSPLFRLKSGLSMSHRMMGGDDTAESAGDMESGFDTTSIIEEDRRSASSSPLSRDFQRQNSSRKKRRKKRITDDWDFKSIIDDGKGHINVDLARSIWEWDNAHRQQQHQQQKQQPQPQHEAQEEEGDARRSTAPMPKFKYSTRAGLRLVDSLAREILATMEDESSPTSSSSTSTSTSSISNQDDVDDDTNISTTIPTGDAATYNDLIQEGVIALMQAMSSFHPQPTTDNKTDDDDHDEHPPHPNHHHQTAVQHDQHHHSFETHAKPIIRRAMYRVLSDTSRPIRLPSHVQEIVSSSIKITNQLRDEYNRDPTLSEIAQRVGVTPDKLRLYQLLSGNTSFVSVESSVEIYDPALEPTSPTFADEDEYEAEHGVDEALLHSGEEELLEEEEEWVEPQRIVAPLRDFIADGETPTPDDVALTDMIRHDVDDFLSKTLDDREREVIRLRFGLHDGSGRGLTLNEIGVRLGGITKQRVKQIMERAMDKLRQSYSNFYVEQYLDDEHETFEDSV